MQTFVRCAMVNLDDVEFKIDNQTNNNGNVLLLKKSIADNAQLKTNELWPKMRLKKKLLEAPGLKARAS